MCVCCVCVLCVCVCGGGGCVCVGVCGGVGVWVGGGAVIGEWVNAFLCSAKLWFVVVVLAVPCCSEN